MKKTGVALFAVALLLAGCGTEPTATQQETTAPQAEQGQQNGTSDKQADQKQTAAYRDVTVIEAKQLITEGKVTVIDVRTPEEYAEGHIPGSKLVPLQELEGRLADLPDKDTQYLIVCRSGNRSAQASDLLVKNGYTRILNMVGGMNEWKFETEK